MHKCIRFSKKILNNTKTHKMVGNIKKVKLKYKIYPCSYILVFENIFPFPNKILHNRL